MFVANQGIDTDVIAGSNLEGIHQGTESSFGLQLLGKMGLSLKYVSLKDIRDYLRPNDEGVEINTNLRKNPRSENVGVTTNITELFSDDPNKKNKDRLEIYWENVGGVNFEYVSPVVIHYSDGQGNNYSYIHEIGDRYFRIDGEFTEEIRGSNEQKIIQEKALNFASRITVSKVTNEENRVN